MKKHPLEKLIGANAPYTSIVFNDTETTGLLDYDESGHLKNQTIEVACLKVTMNSDGSLNTEEMDEFVKLPEGQTLDPKIVELTHITDEMIANEGKSEDEVADMVLAMISDDPEHTLFCTHNVNFDIRFMRELLWKTKGTAAPLDKMDILDTLTVAKDRKCFKYNKAMHRSEGHKLCYLIPFYGLEDKVVNSHRAIDDTKALMEVAIAMDKERSDLLSYVNIIGYNPKYGVDKPVPEGIEFVEAPYRYRGADMVGVKNTIPALLKASKKEAEKPTPSRNGKLKVPTNEKVLEYLASVGLTSEEEIDSYLNFAPSDFRDVTQMKDADKFLDRLVKVIQNNEHIVIYGDYDCDGVSGTAIALRSLRLMGVDADYFINDRFKEGYGLNPKGIDRLLQKYPDVSLIVTLDNGISSAEGIEYVQSLGKNIDVIVSDHHPLAPGKELPKCPVVDEWRPDEDESKREAFCGAELIRRLMVEVAKRIGQYEDNKVEFNKLISFSGCATIADSVPMTAANHYIGRLGIKQMESHVFPCWNSVPQFANEETVGYTYGPLINASSRMSGMADVAVEFMMADDDSDAKIAEEQLGEYNKERKLLTKLCVTKAKQEIVKNGWDKDSIIVIKDETIPVGIAGLVASSICEEYHVPCLCLTADGGSGRSVGHINIKDALEQCMDLLDKFGGHAMACGLASQKPDELRERLKKIVPYQTVDEAEGVAPIPVQVGEITTKMADEVEKMMPYGPGFERPIWSTDGLVSDIKIMKSAHSKIELSDGRSTITCVEFNKVYHNIVGLNAVGKLNINHWNGNTSVQFMIDHAEAI